MWSGICTVFCMWFLFWFVLDIRVYLAHFCSQQMFPSLPHVRWDTWWFSALISSRGVNLTVATVKIYCTQWGWPHRYKDVAVLHDWREDGPTVIAMIHHWGENSPTVVMMIYHWGEWHFMAERRMVPQSSRCFITEVRMVPQSFQGKNDPMVMMIHGWCEERCFMTEVRMVPRPSRYFVTEVRRVPWLSWFITEVRWSHSHHDALWLAVLLSWNLQ